MKEQEQQQKQAQQRQYASSGNARRSAARLRQLTASEQTSDGPGDEPFVYEPVIRSDCAVKTHLRFISESPFDWCQDIRFEKQKERKIKNLKYENHAAREVES